MSYLANLLMRIPPVVSAPPAGITPGTAMGGGFYGGRIKIGANSYDLIVTSRYDGNFSDWCIGTFDFDIETNDSQNDGWTTYQNAITEGLWMYMAHSQMSYNSWGGFTDWYLGSKEEMEIIYRNLKPSTVANVTTSGTNSSSIPTTGNYTTSNPTQTVATAFRTGGSEAFDEATYLTSSRSPTGKQYTYLKSFADGSDSEGYMTDRFHVRAIRRILVV